MRSDFSLLIPSLQLACHSHSARPVQGMRAWLRALVKTHGCGNAVRALEPPPIGDAESGVASFGKLTLASEFQAPSHAICRDRNK